MGQLAVTLVLLVGGGLLLKSLFLLENVDAGFQPDHVMTAGLALPRAKYDTRPRLVAYYCGAIGRMAALQGVQAAGVVNILPLTAGSSAFSFQIIGRPPLGPDETPQRAEYLVASPGYLSALNIPLIAGRNLIEADDASAHRVVLISDAMAHRFWPGESALDARLKLPWDTTIYTVIGIVGSVRDASLVEADHWQGQMYLSYLQAPQSSMTLVIRGTRSPTELAQLMRRSLAEIDPGLPAFDVRAMNQVVARAIVSQRVTTWLTAAMATLALVLAVLRIYGAIAEYVNRRTYEIGVRVALGASRNTVLWLVMRRGMRLVIPGSIAGIVLAWAVTRTLKHLLYGIGTTDPAIFILVPLLLAGAVLAACLRPAYRASSVDPTVALRAE